MTFKAGTDDVRDSPALEVINRLRQRGADVIVHDPVAEFSPDRVRTVDDPYEVCRDADLLVVLTEWPHFAKVDLHKVAELLTGTTVYDTRGIVDPEQAAAAGLDLVQPGRRR